MDTHKNQGLRNQLVATIKQKGISDKEVLRAIGIIPRHLFMDSGFVDFSYIDQAFPIAADQTISQPYTVAFQSQLLQVNKNDRILEIGTGSGYQTAVLIEMGAKVYSIERQNELFKKIKIGSVFDCTGRVNQKSVPKRWALKINFFVFFHHVKVKQSNFGSHHCYMAYCFCASNLTLRRSSSNSFSLIKNTKNTVFDHF